MTTKFRVLINVALLALIIGIAYVGYRLAIRAERNGDEALREIGGGLVTGSVVGLVVFSYEQFLEWVRDRRDNDLAGKQADRDVNLATEQKRHSLITALTVKDDLRGIVLANHDLLGIVLSGRNLTEANLLGADLSEANLNGAHLNGANLNEANLEGAVWDETTVWPDGFTPPMSRSETV